MREGVREWGSGGVREWGSEGVREEVSGRGATGARPSTSALNNWPRRARQMKSAGSTTLQTFKGLEACVLMFDMWKHGCQLDL